MAQLFLVFCSIWFGFDLRVYLNWRVKTFLGEYNLNVTCPNGECCTFQSGCRLSSLIFGYRFSGFHVLGLPAAKTCKCKRVAAFQHVKSIVVNLQGIYGIAYMKPWEAAGQIFIFAPWFVVVADWTILVIEDRNSLFTSTILCFPT